MANVQLRSFGGLNTDSHIQDIRNGDYTDAKNIDHVSTADGESLAITPRVGNEFGFSLGEVTPQNKSYLFVFPADSAGPFGIYVKRSDTVNLLIPSEIIITNFSTAASQITAAFATSGFDVIVSSASSTNQNYSGQDALILKLNPNDPELRYYDFIIENSGNATSLIDIQVYAESISPSRCGLLEVVGSKNI